MNKLSLLALMASSGFASAQGLMGVLPTLEQMESRPFAFGAGLNVGYDTNVNTSSTNETESFYMGATLSGDYRYITDRTVFTIGASGGANYYPDQTSSFDDILYSWRIGGSITHAVSDRLSIDDKFYFSYDFDPNFMYGASINRANDEYIFAFNSFNVNYMWTDRLSTSTGVTVGTTLYDADAISTSEDRLEFSVNQLVRYALTEYTGLRANYRFTFTDYDSGDSSNSHGITVGADHQFDEYTMGLIMVGVEFYDNEGSGDSVKPYMEVGLTRSLTEQLSLQWASRLGHESSSVGIYGSNYTFRTNVDLRYQISEKLSASAGASYLYTDYDGTSTGVGNSEQLWEGRASLRYAITSALGLGLSYTYTHLDSDVDLDSYDRQRINFGVNASF